MLMVDGRPRQKPATTMGMGPKRDGPLRRDAVDVGLWISDSHFSIQTSCHVGFDFLPQNSPRN